MRKSTAHLGRRTHPDWLRDMAEEVWQLLCALTATPQDPDTLARLDRIHEDYRARYADAVALTFDHTRAESVLAAREARDAQRATLQQLRRTSRSHAARARARWAGARRPRSCAEPSYAASPAADWLVRRLDAGDALAAGARLLVEVLVLDQVQHRHPELAARA